MRLAILIGIATVFSIATAALYIYTSEPIPKTTGELPKEGNTHTLTEFGDFACPHCTDFALDILPQLERDFLTTGFLTFTYRHYPFISPGSYQAAQAAECARDQDAFHDYHLDIYQAAATNPQTDYLSTQNLTALAEANNLDVNQFRHCVETQVHNTTIKRDKELGKRMGVNGTPALFLNNQRLRWHTYADLQTAIHQHLRSHLHPGTTSSK